MLYNPDESSNFGKAVENCRVNTPVMVVRRVGFEVLRQSRLICHRIRLDGCCHGQWPIDAAIRTGQCCHPVSKVSDDGFPNGCSSRLSISYVSKRRRFLHWTSVYTCHMRHKTLERGWSHHFWNPAIVLCGWYQKPLRQRSVHSSRAHGKALTPGWTYSHQPAKEIATS